MLELEIPDGSARRALPCEAVLFDMDGTLVDSTACVESTWRAWADRHALDFEALMRVAHGRQNHETIRAIAPHLNTPAEIAALVRAEEECRDGIVAVAGASALLALLPAHRWAVVTSAWRRLAEIRLACARLPVPPVLIAAEQAPRSKPHPDGYLAAAQRLGVDPARCVVIEDAPAGIASGRAAGMTVIGITTTFSRQDLGCDLAIEDFRAVTISITGGTDTRW